MKNKIIIFIVCAIVAVAIIMILFIVHQQRAETKKEIWRKTEQGETLTQREIEAINADIISSHLQRMYEGMTLLVNAYSSGSIKNLTPAYFSIVKQIQKISKRGEFRDFTKHDVSYIEFYLRKIPTKEAGDLLRMFCHARYQEYERLYPIDQAYITAVFLDTLKSADFDYYGITEAMKNHDPYFVIPSFLPLLNHDEPMIRYCAANILGWFKDERASPTLKEAIEKLHPQITKKYMLKEYDYDSDDTLMIFRDAIKRIGETGYNCDVDLPLVKVVVDTVLDTEIRKSAIGSLMSLKIPVEVVTRTEIEPGCFENEYKITVTGKEYYTIIR